MWGRLLEAGIRIHEYRGSMMHAKVLIVDGIWAVLGTTNMDNRSFEHNDEVNVAMRDAAVAARLDGRLSSRPRGQRRDHPRALAGAAGLGEDPRAVHLDPGAPAVSPAPGEARGSGRRHVDLRVATYNIHRARGMDRRVSPARIAEVLREIDADIIALQEVVGAGPSGSGQAEEIGAALGMGWVMAPVRHLRKHLFGNVIMSRFPVLHHTQYRPVVADVRGARLPARRPGPRRRPAGPHVQRAPRHRRARAPLPGTAARRVRPRPSRRPGRRSSSATSTSGCAGWRPRP